MKQFLLLIIISLSTACSLTDIFGQSILWQYEVSADVKNCPGTFWVDDAGTGYFNIKKENPLSPNSYAENLCLLMLDKHGQFKGSTFINNCNSRSLLMPFGTKHLLSDSQICDSSGRAGSMRIFDYEGNLVKKGGGFDGNCYSRIQTPIGFSFFQQSIQSHNQKDFTIGAVDSNFNISYTVVPWAPVLKPNLTLSLQYQDPVLLSDNSWVVPISYLNVGFVKSGRLIGVNQDQITWQYPDSLQGHLICFATTDELIGAFIGRDKIAILNQSGQELYHFNINSSLQIRDMLMTDEHLIFLGLNGVYWFDYEGNMVSKVDLPDLNLRAPSCMQLDHQGNIYLASTRNSRTVISKIGFPYYEEAPAPAVINYAKFDAVSAQTLSVSVFPNPATVYINFVLQEDNAVDQPIFIQIFSPSGSLMEEKMITGNKYELDLSAYKPGTYFYKINSKLADKPAYVSGRFMKIGI